MLADEHIKCSCCGAKVPNSGFKPTGNDEHWEFLFMFNTDYNIQVYWKEDLVCKIQVQGCNVDFENFTKDWWKLPFGINTSATIEDLEEFYEDRCFPKERANCRQILQTLGVDCYEPELICRKTHGLQFDAFMWLQFSDEPQVCWNDIKLRD